MYSGPHIFDRYCNFTCINQERACRADAPDGKNSQISAVDAFRRHRRFALISTSLYMDNSLQEFVSRQYDSPEDYFSGYREYIQNSLLQGVSRITNSVIRVYADNETLINGSEFARLSTVSQEPWYQQYTADGYSPRLLFSYDETDGRQVLFLRGMNSLYSDKAERLSCIEINYSTLDRDFQNMGITIQFMYAAVTGFCLRTQCPIIVAAL